MQQLIIYYDLQKLNMISCIFYKNTFIPYKFDKFITNFGILIFGIHLHMYNLLINNGWNYKIYNLIFYDIILQHNQT